MLLTGCFFFACKKQTNKQQQKTLVDSRTKTRLPKAKGFSQKLKSGNSKDSFYKIVKALGEFISGSSGANTMLDKVMPNL